MMKLLFTTIFCSITFCVFPQNPDSIWIVTNYAKKEVLINMRDGIKLFTAVYIPKSNAEKHPIILFRTGYSAKPYGEHNFTPIWNNPRKYFFLENYIYVIQDVRGRNKSEGKFEDIRPYNPDKKDSTQTDESTDAYDTIDWLVKNIKNNNNRVGILGTSYPGFYATMAALSNHPSLKAVSPQAPVIDWFMGDDYHHNGAFMLVDAFFHHKKPIPHPSPNYPEDVIFSVKDNYAYFLRAGNIKAISKIMADTVRLWNSLIKHPDYDAWWQARNVRNFVDKIPTDVATLIVGGLYDGEDCFGALSLYRSIESKAKNTNKLVMGPWSHGQWGGMLETSLGNIRFESNTSKWFSEEIEEPFFAYYLKDIGRLDKIKEATIFFSGSNDWKRLDKWPPIDSRSETMYFQKNGKLSFVKHEQPTKNSFDNYISDPDKPVPYTEGIQLRRSGNYMTDDQRFASKRPDVLVYQTDILMADKTIAGPVIADLMVSTSTTDADFIVKIIDVFPDDFKYEEPLPNHYEMGAYQMLVRGDIMRGKYRNSFEKPEPFIPHKPTQVKFTLNDIAHTFKKGHRIMVQIQSSWFPLFDRNPQKFLNIYEAKIADFQKANIHIYLNNSKITLHTLD